MMGGDLEQRLPEVMTQAEAAVEKACRYRQDHADQLKQAQDRMIEVKDRINAAMAASQAVLKRSRRTSDATPPTLRDPSLDFPRSVTALQADTDPLPGMRMGMAQDGR